MLADRAFLRKQLQSMIVSQSKQGFDVDGLEEKLLSLPDSYDALAALADELENRPLKPDWPWVEPNDWDTVCEECAPDRPAGLIGDLPAGVARERIEAAFDAAVAGCILGKPLEVDPTLAELRAAAEPLGEWPLRDYVSVKMLENLGRRHSSWRATCRENIAFVTHDDDINYSVIGMLVLEQHGTSFSRRQLMDLWLGNLPPMMAWGPERTALLKAGILSLYGFDDAALASIPLHWNPGAEACGAAIRVDAYGYACLGNPQLAAELAWRDAGMTHMRTGIYASMFIAAAIAVAPLADKPLDIFETALNYIPQRTRFADAMRQSLKIVSDAADWIDGYEQIRSRYGEFRHCQLYQECGQLINTARFARDAGDAICMQVMQGNDTDCFGKIIGSIMGGYFGPSSLAERWLAPFQDRLHCCLADFYETSLSAVRRRMGNLQIGRR